MQLSLQGVVPLPLREKITATSSGLWKQQAVFSKGEQVFVQAPSGTGKTTLIHILYGLRKDYDGAVTWGNIPLQATGNEALATLRSSAVSIIFQDMRLFAGLTAQENIEIKRQLTNTVTAAQAGEWMDRLGLKDKKSSAGGTLSYGEQQRVAIIRAMVQPFDWLLMDEPFSHLDHGNTQKAIALISEVVQQHGAGMLMADLDANNYFPYTKTIML